MIAKEKTKHNSNKTETTETRKRKKDKKKSWMDRSGWDQNTPKVNKNADFNQTILNNANFQRKHLLQETNKQISPQQALKWKKSDSLRLLEKLAVESKQEVEITD